MPLRLLVLDAYAPEGRAALRAAGGTEAGRLYARMLRRIAPDAAVDVAYPADPAPDLPGDCDLGRYDGIAWTGSSLTILTADDPPVARQIAFARAAFDAGVPSFGSCWAAQLAVVAAGGRCAANPRGREFGIARRIALSSEGRGHPLFRGKPAVFDAFTSHADEVSGLSAGAALLASNDWCRVQAVSVERGGGRFWAVQYHPEYDLHEIASLARLRTAELVQQRTFASRERAERWIGDLETLHADPEPARSPIAASLGLGPELLDERLRTREVRNWIESLAPEADRGRATG